MADARIIYVTGMKPKPEPALHREELMRVLAAAMARKSRAAADWLGQRPENFVLVSWTSLLYDERRDIQRDRAGVERLLADPVASVGDRREADAIALKLKRAWHLIGDSFPWLSSLVATAALRHTLADVHRYLDNEDNVAERIRGSLIVALEAAWAAGDRVLVIGHSLGSVIAYDCLWQLTHRHSHPGRVSLLLTLGSPLATRFIRKGLLGADRRGAERYPHNIGAWVNVAARGEMVSLHRRVKPFFAEMLRLGLVESIEDVPSIYNHFRRGDGSLNAHKSYGYLNHAAVAARICRWLG